MGPPNRTYHVVPCIVRQQWRQEQEIKNISERKEAVRVERNPIGTRRFVSSSKGVLVEYEDKKKNGWTNKDMR